MATTSPVAHLSSVPTFGDFDLDDDDHLVDEPERVSFTMIARFQQGKKITKRPYQLTAWAETDAGSLLHMLGSSADAVRQMNGIQAFMMRALVDDDGVPFTAMPRLVSDDDLERAEAMAETAQIEFDTGEPDTIPEHARLVPMKKSALVALAERHHLSTDGTKDDLIAGLDAARDYLDTAPDPGSDLATTDDDDEVVDDARWRLVFPDGQLAEDGEFDTLVAAQEHARLNPSSRRLFFDVIGDPTQKVKLEALNDIVGHIAGKAAGRPTQPSAGSSRSRPKKARRGRS